MSFRDHKTLILCALAVSSLLLVYAPQPVAAATISIPITIKGLSPQSFTSVTIDGKAVGTIPGDGTKSFKVDKSSAHTFQVDAEIKGVCTSYEGRDVCNRFVNSNNVWTLDVISTQNCQTVPVCYDYYYYCDYWGYCWYQPYCTYQQQCWTTTELAEKGHTFAYDVENQVVVVNPHGQNTDTWQKVDQTVSLTAEKSVVTRDESNVKERDVFVHWVVNGAPMEGNTLSMKSDKPLFIRAEYQTESSYRVRVSSEFGNPTMDSVDGWYVRGQEATISVEQEVPSEGIMGALGGKKVFVAWRSPRGVESRDPTYAFSVQDATSLQAQWRTDNSQPMTILGALAVAVVVVLAIFALYRTGRLFRPKAEAEPTELEKAQAEIESLKEQLKKKTPPEEPE